MASRSQASPIIALRARQHRCAPLGDPGGSPKNALDAPGRWLTEKQLRPQMQLSPDEQLRSMGMYLPATILPRRLVG